MRKCPESFLEKRHSRCRDEEDTYLGRGGLLSVKRQVYRVWSAMEARVALLWATWKREDDGTKSARRRCWRWSHNFTDQHFAVAALSIKAMVHSLDSQKPSISSLCVRSLVNFMDRNVL